MNVVKIISIVGTILSVAGTVVGGIADKKSMSTKVAEEVAKQLSKK